MFVPTPTNPYSSGSGTADPLGGLTNLTAAIQDALGSLIVGLLAFVVAAVCIAIWRNIQPELPGMVGLGVTILASGIFGLTKVGDTFNTLDAATGGLLGKLFALAIAFSPLLVVVGLLALFSKWLERY